MQMANINQKIFKVMARKFNRDNCCSSVRAVIKDGSTTITLCGKHAYEQSIIKSVNGSIIMTKYPNRLMASKDWKELLKEYS